MISLKVENYVKTWLCAIAEDGNYSFFLKCSLNYCLFYYLVTLGVHRSVDKL
jgi:hypothetical protein